ncbi:chorismate mutase [Metabacillus litoralis]|uniref:chorismate mutase n=1 Tax=Metabacillus litoralis TaxID=152268 RepID=UPI001CFDAF52|nr:chorismate mutase [Metabacillus litoralis]
MIRGIRGATTVDQNEANMIVEATSELLYEMIQKNNIHADDVAHVIITVTEDLNATFPAKALREIEGWTYVPVMCMQEIPVPGSLEKCIRIMMTVQSDIEQNQIQHVYARNSVVLRPDLIK